MDQSNLVNLIEILISHIILCFPLWPWVCQIKYKLNSSLNTEYIQQINRCQKYTENYEWNNKNCTLQPFQLSLILFLSDMKNVFCLDVIFSINWEIIARNLKYCGWIKTKYSRMDQVKFVEGSL